MKNVQKHFHSAIPIIFVCILVAVGGLIAKLPDFLDQEYSDVTLYQMRNISAFFLPSLAILYLVIRENITKKTIVTTLGIIVLAALYMNLIPNYVFPGKIGSYSDSLLLACLHVPFVYWFAGGVAWINSDYKDLSNRFTFLTVNGELLLTSVWILLGGIVLSALTMALFSLIDLEIFEFMSDWVAIFGAIACPLVALLLILTKKTKTNMLVVLARVFAPFITIIVLIFLALVFLRIRNPFEDRDFLIVIDGLLFAIVVVGTYIIIHRTTLVKTALDYVITILFGSGFLIGLIAIIAVFLRLQQDGFTPNRIALIGMNVLFMINIGGILWHEINWYRNKTENSATSNWIAKYIPVYFFWALFMVFLFPWLCRLR